MWTPNPGRAAPRRGAVAALTLLLAASAGLSGCTGERRLEAADGPEAPLVTIRTLSPAESRAPAKPVLHQAAAAEVVKPEPPKPAAPRRTRRRTRRLRREQPAAPARAPAAVAPGIEPVKAPGLVEPTRPEAAPAEKREQPEPRLSFPLKKTDPEPAPDPEPVPDPGSDN